MVKKQPLLRLPQLLVLPKQESLAPARPKGLANAPQWGHILQQLWYVAPFHNYVLLPILLLPLNYVTVVSPIHFSSLHYGSFLPLPGCASPS